MRNHVNLITYVDRLSGGDFRAFRALLRGPLQGVFGGVHVLPFYNPIDGADAGFDPIDHTSVDPRLGDWEDIKKLSGMMDVMTDMVVNHVSVESSFFQDYLLRGEESPYSDMFLTLNKVFPHRVDESDLLGIYRPRPGLPFSAISKVDNTKELFWTTFTSQQVDIDVHSSSGRAYLESILQHFADNGVKLIRLDAVGYAIKKAGTSCFMIPETFDFIDTLTTRTHELGMKVIVEIHSYYQDQIEIAKKVDYVYDFALPPLILHALYKRTGEYINQWLDISPHNCVTVLDTHDGIGVIDIGPHSLDKSKKGLIPNEDIEFLVEEMHRRNRDQSRLSTGTAASNLDLYQVNCTYYDALGQHDDLYIIARAIQFFSPGIPQVYYMGLLAEPNDMDLLALTQVGRDINRHYYNTVEVVDAMKRPVVQRLIKLIKYRNTAEAFQGEFSCNYLGKILTLSWQNGAHKEVLEVDFSQLSAHITSIFEEEILRRHKLNNTAVGA